jgi:hypothetical protein
VAKIIRVNDTKNIVVVVVAAIVLNPRVFSLGIILS